MVPRNLILKYIRKFINIPNLYVYFKMRPDMTMIECKNYLGSLHKNKNLFIIKNLDDDLIKDIDVVTCVQSIFPIEMLKYKKIIWYLNNDFHFLDNIFRDFNLFKIELKNIKNIINNKKNFKKAYEQFDEKKIRYLFSSKRQKIFLKEILNK